MRILTIIGLCVFLFLLGCQQNDTEINSFSDCVEAGYPVMESYPRQCAANGDTFVEEIDNQVSFHECTQEEKDTQACTLEYDPVCGYVDNGVRCITTPCPSFNAETFGNGCSACAEGANGYYMGECADREFVVCQETGTGFNATDYALQSNGICVDICPGNYDAYGTQTGISLCIEHYGVAEIEQWEMCEKSTDNCNCVRTYETTSGDPIENAAYRCVATRYANRLLFRGGMDRLDENGDQGTVIA